MPTPPAVDRAREDACPGVLRLAEAADGSLARVRLVGGLLSAQGFSALADAAHDLGDGRVELTSRGNAQLRGLDADAGPELGSRLRGAGLWPSQTHERVRNIVASPLSGLDRVGDVTGAVRALDEALCASARLAQLSGRFLFAFDDGRGDMAALQPDVLVRSSTGDPVGAALAVAHAFLDERAEQGSTAWRVAELTGGATRIYARAGVRPWSPPVLAKPPAAGPFTRVDGRRGIVLAVPLGRLEPAQLRWLADHAVEQAARITPWRSIVLPLADAAVVSAAAELGFGVTPDSPWSNLSACAGRPGCAKALADVQRDARSGLGRWPGRLVHWSGCGRRCGRPARTEVDVIATESGYVIEGN